ncbi:DUF4386 domain-containing protein [Halobacillus locisalis]|uniref:DUF4386 domain-containing protein n=1 Tax=Halobacillus locisalis TaxID=220753 RepID=A0A838CW21_9BACI|nr:DUF4386 domain-containing protein [Halobacillus locisalis]MBA2176029.1 DUF4386 domain-containing protein [Halobacillus locisalis]
MNFILKASKRSAALVAGISLLIMTLAAFFSYGYVHSTLVIPDDAAATFENIQDSLALFRLGIAGWVVIIAADLLVSWAFYTFFKTVDVRLAQVVGGLRLLYTLILSIAVFQLAGAAVMRSASEVMAAITSFEVIWSFGLIVFGVHLVMTGIVASKAGDIPRLWSVLLVAGGAGYMVVHALYRFLPQFDSATAILEAILMLPMMAGELGFGVWLLVKALQVKKAAVTSWLGAS